MGLFAKPEVDIEKHIELRMRRIFPVSWEYGLHQKYQEALKEYQAQQEFLKEFFELQTKASVLSNRVDIFSWLKKNLSMIEEATDRGEYNVTKDLLRELRVLVEAEEAKNRRVLEDVVTVAKSKGITISTSTSIPVSIVTTGKQSTGSARVVSTISEQIRQQPTEVIYTTPSGGQYYYNPNTGVLIDTRTGEGWSTATPEKMIAKIETQKVQQTQPASLFGNFIYPRKI